MDFVQIGTDGVEQIVQKIKNKKSNMVAKIVTKNFDWLISVSYGSILLKFQLKAQRYARVFF